MDYIITSLTLFVVAGIGVMTHQMVSSKYEKSLEVILLAIAIILLIAKVITMNYGK